MAHEGVQAQPVHIRFRPILTPTIQTTPHYAEALGWNHDGIVMDEGTTLLPG